MYLKIVCLNELNRNHFYLLPLRLLLFPLNENCFSNIVGFCVYYINTKAHALNTRREIPYLRAPMYYRLYI